MAAWLVLMLSLLLWQLPATDGQDYHEMKSLITNLLADYDKTLRPVITQSDPVNLSVAIGLISLTELSEIQQTVEMKGYLRLTWSDHHLVWDPLEHANISVISPYTHQVWTPQLELSNSVHHSQLTDSKSETPLRVDYNGSVSHYVLVTMKVPCKLDMTRFPYDSHSCTFDMEPVMYDDQQVSIILPTSKPYMSYFSQNGEWELKSSFLYRDTYNSPSGATYPFVTLSVTFQRLPRFFVLNLLFPTCALSFLNILVFILPADSGEKVGYAITVLLSVMFFISDTNNELPPSSDIVPLITQFLTALVTISILSVIATVAILFIHHKQEKEERRNNLMTNAIRRFRQNVSANTPKLKVKGPSFGQRQTNGPDLAWTSDVSSKSKDNTNKTSQDSVSHGHIAGLPLRINSSQRWGNLRSLTTAGNKDQSPLSPLQTSSTLTTNLSQDLENKMLTVKPMGPSEDVDATEDSHQAPPAQTQQRPQLHNKEKQHTKETGNILFDLSRQEKDTSKDRNDTVTPNSAVNASNIFRQLSANLDKIFFILFFLAWSSINVAYLIALFSS